MRAKPKKAHLIRKACPRCGQLVMGLTQPLHYTNEIFKKLGGVCGSCITPEERELLTDPRSVRRVL